jgi:spoIIIJ-associated protein
MASEAPTVDAPADTEAIEPAADAPADTVAIEPAVDEPAPAVDAEQADQTPAAEADESAAAAEDSAAVGEADESEASDEHVEAPAAAEEPVEALAEEPSEAAEPAEGTEDAEDRPESREGSRRPRRRGGRGRGRRSERSEAPPRDALPPAEGDVAEAAADCAVVLARLADLDLEIEVLQGDDQTEVELTGEDREVLVKAEGRVLLAIQHLLPRLMQGTLGQMVPCRVDSDGFRDSRVADLERLAAKTADEVRRRNRPRTLRPMNPADRRTVHLALKEDEDVTTESAGDGFYKRVTVRPVR